MIKYKYIGGWKTHEVFFTKNKVYEVETKNKNGAVELKDDSFDEYGLGFTVSKSELNDYFEEVTI